MSLFSTTVKSYSLQLLVDAWRQHDAGHDGPQQQDEGVDDPGHRGVPDARTAAAHQTRCTAAETWHLEERRRGEKGSRCSEGGRDSFQFTVTSVY